MKVELSVKVTPQASKERIIKDASGILKLYVTAPAVDGKANKAVIAFCAKKVGVSKSSITILDGEKNRYKTLLFETPFSKEKILQLLGIEQQEQLF